MFSLDVIKQMNEIEFKASCPKCYRKHGRNDHLRYQEVTQVYYCSVCGFQVGED